MNDVPMPTQYEFYSASNTLSLIISSNYVGDGSIEDKEDCLEYLIEEAGLHVTRGEFSKYQLNSGGSYKFGDFTPKDKDYIDQVTL